MDKYKIAFIYGITDEDRKTSDGQLEFWGDNNAENLHSTCLLEFIEEKYSDLKIFKKLNYKHKPETISYFISKVCHHVVFLNTTKDEKRYGKTGVFILPENLSDNQEETILSFCDFIFDYKINLCYDFIINDGLLESKQLSSNDNKTPKFVMESYLNQIHGAKRKTL